MEKEKKKSIFVVGIANQLFRFLNAQTGGVKTPAGSRLDLGTGTVLYWPEQAYCALQTCSTHPGVGACLLHLKSKGSSRTWYGREPRVHPGGINGAQSLPRQTLWK